MPVEEQVVSIFAGTRGYLDDLHTSDVRRFESELLEYVRTQRADVLGEIRSTGGLDEDALGRVVTDFKGRFQSSDGKDDEMVEHTDAEAMRAAAEASFDNTNAG
jgi:F-type H+-transporting ATPase subunit alpha